MSNIPGKIIANVLVLLLFGLNTCAAQTECTETEYLQKRPDVRAAHMNALDHYRMHGKSEGMLEPSKKIFKLKANTEPTSKKRGVIIDSDVGTHGQNYDEDDNQTLAWMIPYMDEFHLEGFVSTSILNNDGVTAFEEWLRDVYAPLYQKINGHAKNLASPVHIGQNVVYGARAAQQGAKPGHLSNGARLIVEAANKYSPENRLQVSVWGSITTVAEAVGHSPEIKERIEVWWIASWNRKIDTKAYEYLWNNHRDLRMWMDDSTFRGIHVVTNRHGAKNYDTRDSMISHVDNVIKGYPYISEYWKKYHLKDEPGKIYKNGDGPSILYILSPELRSDFIPIGGNWMRSRYPDAEWQKGVGYLASRRGQIFDDWKERMDRLFEVP